jgi:hypothetical protein
MFEQTEAKPEKPEHKPVADAAVTLDDFKSHRQPSDAPAAESRDKKFAAIDLSPPIYPPKGDGDRVERAEKAAQEKAEACGNGRERAHLSQSLGQAVKDGRLSSASREKFEHCLRRMEDEAFASRISGERTATFGSMTRWSSKEYSNSCR